MIRSHILPWLRRGQEQGLRRKPGPNVPRLSACLALLAGLAFSRVGQASIVRTPDLLPVVLQCTALTGDVWTEDLVRARQAAILVLRNLSFLESNKLHFVSENSLDTLHVIVSCLRGPCPVEQCLAAEALLSLTYNSTKIRAIVKRHDAWHTELRDSCHRMDLQLLSGDAGADTHLQHRAQKCVEEVLAMLM